MTKYWRGQAITAGLLAGFLFLAAPAEAQITPRVAASADLKWTGTRFYIQNAAADVDPATERGAWDNTASYLARELSRTKSGAIASKAVSENVSTADYDVLLLKLVSEPIPTAQTIAGPLTWVLGARASNGGLNAHWHVHVYVTQGDNDLVRGTLYSNYTEPLSSTTEWPTTAVGDAPTASLSLTSVAIQANDRIVIEVGYVARNTSNNSWTGTLWYGGTGATDLTVGGDETLNPGYFEFTDNLFAGPLTISKPAGTAQNDVMIASIGARPNGPGIPANTVITPPDASWIQVGNRIDTATGTGHSLVIYRKVAGASEPASYDWTILDHHSAVGGIQAFSGVDTVSPIDVENGWSTADPSPGFSYSTPDVTTTVANAMLVTSFITSRGGSTWSLVSTGLTEGFDENQEGYGGSALMGAYGAHAAAGATGQKTANNSDADPSTGSTHILALRPACSPEAGYVWCYATSAATMAPPALDPWSNIVVSGSNDNKLHGMTDAGGTLAFAPFTTGGPLQARPAMLPAEYRTPATTVNIAYVTSQDGYVYAVDTTTGAQEWQSPSLAAANMLQGGTNVWIQALKPLSICGVTTSDVVFVGTRNTATTTANQVYALNGSSSTVTSTGGGNCVANGTGVLPGGILWTFTGGGANKMDIISSVPYVDFTDDAVWVTSRSAGGTVQPSVWKLNASNGTLATGTSTWKVGDIDSAPFPGANGTYMYVGTNAGDLTAIRVSDGADFTHTPTSGTGAIKGQPWPLWYDAVGSGGETIVFSRDVTVHSVNFNGSTFTPNWAKTLTKLVQQNTGGGNPLASLTVTLTTPTTPGNLLVMVGAGWCWSLAAPTGGGVTSWSKAAASLTNTNIEIWYGVVSTSSSTGVTIAMSNASTCALWMNLTEWSGLTQSPVLDKAGFLDGTGTPASASTGATTNPNDLLIFGVAQSSGSTFGAPTLGGTPGPWSAMTAITTPAMQSSWYQVVSATGTYNPSVSVTTAWDAAIAAFKVATVSAPIEDYAGRIYVGGSDGKVHELDVATGADQKQVPTIPIAGTMGEPTINWDVGRIHVGGSDGRIYTFAMPF